jgi:hypothetical protein
MSKSVFQTKTKSKKASSKQKEKIQEVSDKSSSNSIPEWATLTLEDINIAALDRQYVLPEIVKKQDRNTIKSSSKVPHSPSLLTPEISSRSISLTSSLANSGEFADPETERKEASRKSVADSENEMKSMSTSLEKLGISVARKEPVDIIHWGERYKIKLFLSNGDKSSELMPEHQMRCHHCHQFPPKGALMLAVPYRYVPSFIQRHDYMPEWVNMVKTIQVDPVTRNEPGSKGPKTKMDQKSMPKMAYFKQDLPAHEIHKRGDSPENTNSVSADYFDCMKPVCSFPCMVSKGRELAEKDPRFRNAEMLITMLFQKIFGYIPEKLSAAPSFELLKEYGGEYSLEEYRKDFQFVNLEPSSQIYQNVNKLINHSTAIYSSSQN